MLMRTMLEVVLVRSLGKNQDRPFHKLRAAAREQRWVDTAVEIVMTVLSQ